MKRHIDLSMFVQFALAARTCSEEGGVQRTRETSCFMLVFMTSKSGNKKNVGHRRRVRVELFRTHFGGN